MLSSQEGVVVCVVVMKGLDCIAVSRTIPGKVQPRTLGGLSPVQANVLTCLSTCHPHFPTKFLLRMV